MIGDGVEEPLFLLHRESPVFLLWVRAEASTAPRRSAWPSLVIPPGPGSSEHGPHVADVVRPVARFALGLPQGINLGHGELGQLVAAESWLQAQPYCVLVVVQGPVRDVTRQVQQPAIEERADRQPVIRDRCALGESLLGLANLLDDFGPCLAGAPSLTSARPYRGSRPPLRDGGGEGRCARSCGFSRELGCRKVLASCSGLEFGHVRAPALPLADGAQEADGQWGTPPAVRPCGLGASPGRRRDTGPGAARQPRRTDRTHQPGLPHRRTDAVLVIATAWLALVDGLGDRRSRVRSSAWLTGECGCSSLPRMGGHTPGSALAVTTTWWGARHGQQNQPMPPPVSTRRCSVACFCR